MLIRYQYRIVLCKSNSDFESFDSRSNPDWYWSAHNHPCFIKNILICSPKYISFILFPCLYFRHVIFAPSSHNKYAGDSFPGIYDALFDIENAFDQESAWNEVRHQISNAAFTVNAAAVMLRPPAWIYVLLCKNTQNVIIRKILSFDIGCDGTVNQLKKKERNGFLKFCFFLYFVAKESLATRYKQKQMSNLHCTYVLYIHLHYILYDIY